MTLRGPPPPGDVVMVAGLRADEEEVEAVGLAGATSRGPTAGGLFTSADSLEAAGCLAGDESSAVQEPAGS